MWDCATGNGQAAHGLVEHFKEVIATDASEAQLANAVPHERIEYRLAPAEESGLEDGSVDVVHVAQALHWFDFDRFYPEARRVLKPGGILSITLYQHTVIEPALDVILRRFHDEVVGSHWPPRTKWSRTYYRAIPFPFDELESPDDLAATEVWTYPDLLGYIESWSATQRYKRALGADPVDEVRGELAAAWGAPAQERRVLWPLVVRVGR